MTSEPGLVRLADGVGIRAHGPYHGVVIDGVTQPGLCLLNLEHYSCAGRTGRFAPRRTEIRGIAKPDGAVLEFEPIEEWRIGARITYRVRPGYVDADFDFSFDKPYPAFEAFLASYFPVGTPPPWIHAAGGWRRPRPIEKEQVFVPRDGMASRWAQDGRWSVLSDAGHRFRVVGYPFDKAFMVSNLAHSRLGVVQMARPACCSQLSPNTFAPAHDISIVGRDVRAGETVSASVRIAWKAGLDRHEALSVYDRFIREADV